MGAVQRLATVVVLGLVGLASVLILYLADENNRIDDFALNQQHDAVERGEETFLSQCIACHGPAGEGYTTPGESGTGRIGAPLGGINKDLNQTGLTADDKPWSDPKNPQFGTGLEGRRNYIIWRIHNGLKAADGINYIMPAFGPELNGPLNNTQIEELATFIQHADWNKVYNDAVAMYGGYPTAGPPPATVAPQQTPATTTSGNPSAGTKFELDMVDIAFQPTTLEIPANMDVTITLKNTGALPHNFSIASQNISVDVAAGQTGSVQLNLPPGQYDFFCAEPGHKEAGMVGKLTASESLATQGSPEASPAASPAAGGQAGAAAPTGPVEIEMVDIAFKPNSFTIPANTDVTVNLKNSGALPHNFSIPSQNISVDVAPGATGTVTLNLPAGDYDFDCDEPGHKEAGMVGKLTVSEGGGAAGGGGGNAAPAATQPPAQNASAQEIDMVDIAFKPNTFEIPANADAKITLKNTGALPHNFSIPSQNVSYDVAPGQSMDITMNLPAGEYDFDCDEPGHKEAGMTGKLTVK